MIEPPSTVITVLILSINSIQESESKRIRIQKSQNPKESESKRTEAMSKLKIVSIVVLALLVITHKSAGDGASVAKAPASGYSRTMGGITGAVQTGAGAVEQGATAPAKGYEQGVDSMAGKSSGGDKGRR